MSYYVIQSTKSKQFKGYEYLNEKMNNNFIILLAKKLILCFMLSKLNFVLLMF